jgi:hypothetical protein
MTWPWQKRILVTHPRPFNEGELNAALAVSHEDPIWRAVHQLIDVAEANAHENASANVSDQGECAGYVGGAAHLRLLREELYNRRALGIELLGQRAPLEAMKE